MSSHPRDGKMILAYDLRDLTYSRRKVWWQERPKTRVVGALPFKRITEQRVMSLRLIWPFLFFLFIQSNTLAHGVDGGSSFPRETSLKIHSTPGHSQRCVSQVIPDTARGMFPR